MDNFTKLGWAILGFFVGAIVMFFALQFVGPVRAVDVDHTNGPVTVCHYTQTHYVVNTPNKSGNVGGHDNHSHDIIPPFSYWQHFGGQNGFWLFLPYPGKNWTTEGQAVWNNGCEIPPPPTHLACQNQACVVTEGEGSNTCEVDKDCETPPPADSCLNLSGIQDGVPANMVSNSDHFCSCASGFHEVPVEDSKDFTCEKDPGNPPTDNGGGGGSTNTTSAPSCPDRSTTKTVDNYFVTRDGSHATLNFFITEGDSANLYWSQVGQPHWQYALADVKPNSDKFVSYTVNDLDPGVGYDFGVQQKFGCSGGQILTSVVVDGPVNKMFPFSYFEWGK